MTVHFIGAGPGAADLITVRGREIIARCPVCLYAGSIVPRELLSYCPKGARIVDTAPLSLDEIEAEFAAAHAAGQDVARLHSGDLSIYSALAEQLRRLDWRNIPYTMTPGVPAFAAAAAALECELTVPEIAQSVVLTRVPGRASQMPDGEKLAMFAKTGATLVIHLAIHAVDIVARELTPFYGGDCPTAVVVQASSPTQRVIVGTLADIGAKVSEARIERTALILVGRALAAHDFRDSALYDAGYRRRFRGGVHESCRPVPSLSGQRGEAANEVTKKVPMTAWDSLTARRAGIPVFAPGHVWLAGAGPGDPGLLTLDALAGLAQADVVVHDALVDQRVLALAGPQARLEFAGKRGGKPSALQADISERLVALAHAGNRVLRLKGGDPFVFGRGGEEALMLARAGVPFRVIPGVTSGLAALAAAGIPATLRGINRAVIFTAGHGADEDFDWAPLARTGQPIVLYMVMHNLERIVAAIIRAGLAGDTPAAVIASATTPKQRILVSSLEKLPAAAREQKFEPPAIVVIGNVVKMRSELLGDVIATTEPEQCRAD